MSDYFDRMEGDMRRVVKRHGHQPWYSRLTHLRHARLFALLFVGLAVATPAAGAVTNWFGLGAPVQFPSLNPNRYAGRAILATSELLSLRVPDPAGGPPWGVNLVRTTRGDVCLQLGRVVDGRLGSLGIDGAWNNDHEFHPFPNSAEGDFCATSDAVGEGFENVGETGVVANASPPNSARGSQGEGCNPPLPARALQVAMLARIRRMPLRERRYFDALPICASGSTRMVFMGVLGPDAASVTYRAPDGSLTTERTVGTDGAYLLVFPLVSKTCRLYTTTPYSRVDCGDSASYMGESPELPGAVTGVTYRDGKVCTLLPTPRELARRLTLEAKVRRLLEAFFARPSRQSNPFQDPAFERTFTALLARYGTTRTSYLESPGGSCPPVGYVTGVKPVTHADVETPISVKTVRRKWGGFMVELSFRAREPVATSSSWYEDYFVNPPACPGPSFGGEIGVGDIRAGQVIHDTRLLGRCKGIYRGAIGYVARTYHQLIGPMVNTGPPIVPTYSGGGMPGSDGSVIVGRFSFTIR
jgi:hypothetical protein